MSNSGVTPSMEDYLETIYFLRQDNEIVRMTDVAKYLGLSKPSVNKAIELLRSKGFVEHEKYKTLYLTPAGYEIAAAVASRHVALKTFLHEILGVEEKLAEDEACRLEHSMSLDTGMRLCRFVEELTRAK